MAALNRKLCTFFTDLLGQAILFSRFLPSIPSSQQLELGKMGNKHATQHPMNIYAIRKPMHETCELIIIFFLGGGGGDQMETVDNEEIIFSKFMNFELEYLHKQTP